MSDEKRGRGRPIKDTLADFMHGTPKLVFAVFVEQEKLGGQRGSEAKAIRKVAVAHGWDEAALKRAVQREKKTRPTSEVFEHVDRNLVPTDETGPPLMVAIAKNSVRIQQVSDEFSQRTSGIPGHVLERTGSLPVKGFLQLLRAHDVGGNRCPKWLMDALIAQHEERGHALLSVIERAAPRP